MFIKFADVLEFINFFFAAIIEDLIAHSIAYD